MKCPSCGVDNPPEDIYCECGYHLKGKSESPTKTKKCPNSNCNFKNPREAIYCGGCGYELRTEEIGKEILEPKQTAKYNNPHYQQPSPIIAQTKPFYKSLWFYIAVSIVLIILALGSADTSNNDIESMTLECQLATINKGYVSKDDITIRRFKFLLENLDEKCINTKQDIADVVVREQEILRNKYGIKIGLLSLMEGINASIPNGVTNMDRAEVAVVYGVLLNSNNGF